MTVRLGLLLAAAATSPSSALGCCATRRLCVHAGRASRVQRAPMLLADDSAEADADDVVAAEAKVAAAEAKVASLEASDDDVAQVEDAAVAEEAGEPIVADDEEDLPLPSWFDEEGTNALEEVAPPGPMVPEEPEQQLLTMKDLLNTKWSISATPRDDSWLKGGVQQQEFTLLSDSSVVWGGTAGGIGTGGRWSLKDGLLEVIRSTPLGLLTGRDYYMAAAVVNVDEKLQFQLDGVIRSYNALFPVMVIADFSAKRLPGRFVRNVEEDEEDEEDSE